MNGERKENDRKSEGEENGRERENEEEWGKKLREKGMK